MQVILFFLYFLACIVCGLLGRNTAFGFLGHFILSLVLTPIGDFVIQLVGRPSREIRQRLSDVDDE